MASVFATYASVSDNYVGCGGKQNTQPVYDIKPEYLTSNEHGVKYKVMNGTTFTYIVQVKGTYYEMGKAFGTLMRTETQQNLANFNKYIQEQIVDAIVGVKIPKIIAYQLTGIATWILNILLEVNWIVARIFIPQRFEDEMRGMADGSGVPMAKIRQLNMFPELTRASCTIIGAWGEATVDNKLLQLRALDWSSDAPINQNPTITIYHPYQKGSFPFANIGYAGLVGSITAFSSQGIAISEKVWIPTPDNSSIHYSYFGKPWAFVLRDLAEFAHDLEDVYDTLYNTERTAMIHIGVGSAKSQSFMGFEYAHNVLYGFSDKNYTHYNDTNHPELPGVMFWDKHPQPSHHTCLASILKENHGKITPETLYRDVTGFDHTGDTQVCVFDIYDQVIYLSYSEYQTNVKAYYRPLMKINLKDMWDF